MSPTPQLSVQDLVKDYGGKRVLDGLSFSVGPGEIVGLLGPNGAGKTTAFYAAMGLLKPTDGAIFIQGINVTDEPVYQRARRGMGFLAQEPSIFPTLTAEENIWMVLEYQNISANERKNRLEQVLAELHLEAFKNKRAAKLSGGERRRIEIARALATNPKILLMDEPFANIDPITIAEVKDLVRALKARGISILITDHNARELFSLADRNYILHAGRVLVSGSGEALQKDPLARKYYLGETF